MARVWDSSKHSGSELLMLLAIADFSDDAGIAYPAVPTLAAKCRMTPRNANLILAALRRTGELVVRQNEGPKGTNLYQVVFSQTPEASFTPEGRFTLKPASPTPEAGFLKPLKPASDEPSVNRQQPSITRDAVKPHRSKSVDSVPDGFAEFWFAYGKKTGKANSIREWKKLKPDSELIRRIIDAATCYSTVTELKYRKDPERWIRDRRFEDGEISGAKPDFMAGAL